MQQRDKRKGSIHGTMYNRSMGLLPLNIQSTGKVRSGRRNTIREITSKKVRFTVRDTNMLEEDPRKCKLNKPGGYNLEQVEFLAAGKACKLHSDFIAGKAS